MSRVHSFVAALAVATLLQGSIALPASAEVPPVAAG